MRRRRFEHQHSPGVSADAGALDTLFWNDPLTIRYGADEILHGHGEIAAFNARRRPLSPDRALADTVGTTYGETAETVSTLSRHAARASARFHPRRLPVRGAQEYLK
jgi:hypothetical protein